MLWTICFSFFTYVCVIEDDVIADSQSDVKATAKMDIPPELLEFAYFNDPEETVQGITKFSEVSA